MKLSISTIRPYVFGNHLSKIQKGPIKGSLFAPLAQESTISVIWRFCWLNTFSSSDLNTLGIQTNFAKQKRNICNIARSPESHCLLDFPLLIERNIQHVLHDCVDVWFDAQLRVCPICVGCGFHSIWHQFKLLEVCPLHACRLNSCCAYCGGSLGSYQCSFKRAYICGSCGNPFSGVMPQFEDMQEFREQKNCIDRAFKPFELWLSEISPHVEKILSLVTINPNWKYDWQDWGEPQEILLGYACLSHPPPIGCRIPMNWLAQRQISIHTTPSADIKYDINRVKRKFRHSQIYALFLHDLRTWIADTQTLGDHKSYKFSIGFNNTCQKSVNDIRLIAYAAFRTKFESIDADHWDQALHILSFKEAISISCAYTLTSIPDNGVRLYLLGVFSSLLRLVKKHAASGYFDMSLYKTHNSALVAHGFSANQEDKTVMFTLCPANPELESLSIQGLKFVDIEISSTKLC